MCRWIMLKPNKNGASFEVSVETHDLRLSVSGIHQVMRFGSSYCTGVQVLSGS
jgi:hypothetical protein